jgi:hypothetical protein
MRAAEAEQAIAALRTQRSRQEALITTYFLAVAAAEAAEDKIGKVRAAGAEAVAKAKAAADAKVLRAQQDAAPVAAAVKAALVAVAEVVGEANAAELLGVSPRDIRSARRSRTAPPGQDDQVSGRAPVGAAL